MKFVSDLPPHPKCLFLVDCVLVLHPLKYSFTDQHRSRVLSADSWTPTACTSTLAYDRGDCGTISALFLGHAVKIGGGERLPSWYYFFIVERFSLKSQNPSTCRKSSLC